MTAQPCFIVGTQRSGTTLLFQIFNNHEDLYVVNEFWDLYPFVRGEKSDLGELEHLLVSHLGLEMPYLAPGEAVPQEVFDHVELAFETRLRELNKKRWAIKHPRLTGNRLSRTEFLGPYGVGHVIGAGSAAFWSLALPAWS